MNAMQRNAAQKPYPAFCNAKIMQVMSRTKQIWLFFDKTSRINSLQPKHKTYNDQGQRT